MRRLASPLVLLAAILLGIASASAAEPASCEGLAWNLDKERTLLQGAPAPAGAGPLDRDHDQAFLLSLVPFADAHLALPPERQPRKNPSFAGMVAFKAADAAGDYRISLPEAAWVDVVQEGKLVEAAGFAGAEDCPGIHKSVRFHIGAAPFVLQISDAATDRIAVAITPAE
jgi:hypothetical protein